MRLFNKHPAIVLGLFETGLAVGRSLGRNEITVYGIDHKNDIGFYSKYIQPIKSPHPLEEEKDFIKFFVSFLESFNHKPVLFITSDDYLIAISKNYNLLNDYILMNIPKTNLIFEISDKYRQYKLALKAGVNVPYTLSTDEILDNENIIKKIPLPAIIKARDVNLWRAKIGGTTKGFVVSNYDDLSKKVKYLLSNHISFIIQEIIQGPDTNHFKVCIYKNKEGRTLLNFTLQKIRQQPIRFGVGSCVISKKIDELQKIGEMFFSNIDYTGVGSAEFKLDVRDGKYKLIELNPRYWQQNALADQCGMNFPLISYLDVIGEKVSPLFDFKEEIKWINIYSDFISFLDYYKEKKISLKNWITSIQGEKVWSDFSWDDPIPGFYEIRFGKRLFNIPKFILRKLRE